MKVHVAIPPVEEHYPYAAVRAGLNALGHRLLGNDRPLDADMLVVWSPWKRSRREALFLNYKRAGKPVLVMENGWLSPLFSRGAFYQIAHDGWNGTGYFPGGGIERWRSWGLEPLSWCERSISNRTGYALVIGQRGHLYDERTSSLDWSAKVDVPGCPADFVIRRSRECTRPLSEHLAGAAEAHVWSSNAAAHALLWGVPVVQHGPNLMVENMASKPGAPLVRPDRTAEFERLAWAQWTAEEIVTGEPFARLLA